MTDLTEALREAWASCPPSVIEYATVEIHHPTWDAPVRLVQGRDNLTATLEASAPRNPGETVTFAAFPFTFTLPKKGEGRQELMLTIENATRLLMSAIESLDLSTDSPVRVIYRPYLSSDLSGPHMNPPLQLTVRTISATPKAVTLTCGYADFANRRFPWRVYRIEEFPGLASRV
jgi:hypothetical protein